MDDDLSGVMLQALARGGRRAALHVLRRGGAVRVETRVDSAWFQCLSAGN